MRQKEIERELRGREIRVRGRMRNEIHEKKRQEKERLEEEKDRKEGRKII